VCLTNHVVIVATTNYVVYRIRVFEPINPFESSVFIPPTVVKESYSDTDIIRYISHLNTVGQDAATRKGTLLLSDPDQINSIARRLSAQDEGLGKWTMAQVSVHSGILGVNWQSILVYFRRNAQIETPKVSSSQEKPDPELLSQHRPQMLPMPPRPPMPLMPPSRHIATRTSSPEPKFGRNHGPKASKSPAPIRGRRHKLNRSSSRSSSPSSELTTSSFESSGDETSPDRYAQSRANRNPKEQRSKSVKRCGRKRSPSRRDVTWDRRPSYDRGYPPPFTGPRPWDFLYPAPPPPCASNINPGQGQAQPAPPPPPRTSS
jgi:hypothetical protein